MILASRFCGHCGIFAHLLASSDCVLLFLIQNCVKSRMCIAQDRLYVYCSVSHDMYGKHVYIKKSYILVPIINMHSV